MTPPEPYREPERTDDVPAIPAQRSAPPEYLSSANRDSSDRDRGEADEWSYDYRGRRGADVAFTGHVVYVSGEAGERLLGGLGAVLRDLLEWANSQQQSESEGGGLDDSTK